MTEIVYQDDSVTLIHGDAREVVANGGTWNVDLVLTDPPYGINLQANYKSRKRTALAECNDFPNVVDDDKPFDPTYLLKFDRLVLFGANYYADKLPPSASWIVWDKLSGLESKREIGFNDNADLEMAWSNLGGPARLIPHRWMGMLKDSERQERRVHPTQKPIALMQKIIEWRSSVGDLIFDPYAGSGSTLLAAIRSGRRALGVEIDPGYCQVIADRLKHEHSRFRAAVVA